MYYYTQVNISYEIKKTTCQNKKNPGTVPFFDTDDADSITFHCSSRMIAQSEANIKEYLARRDTLKEILGEE